MAILVQVTTLMAELAKQSDQQPLVVDCRYRLTDRDAGFKDYLQGHIPQAQYLSLSGDLSVDGSKNAGRHPLPTAQDFAVTLARIGFSADRQVVVYDDAGGQIAARFWWLCKSIGFDQVALLDGGWQAWVDAGGAVSTGQLMNNLGGHAQTTVQAARAQRLVVSEAELKQQLAASNCRLIDARVALRYRGEQEPMDAVAGHIAGAVNHPSGDNLDGQFKFLSADILAEKFNQLLGPYSPDQVIHSCGSGVTACHNLFAMELAGLSGSRLYPPSWSGWIADPDNFYLQGEAGQESELLRVGS